MSSRAGSSPRGSQISISTRTEDILNALEVHGSGVNRIILQTSAEHCHGVAMHPLAGFSPYLEDTVVPALADGASRAHWRAGKLWTSLWYITSVHQDPDVARRRAAALLAFYFSTPSYQTPIQGTRWEQTGADLRDGLRAGRPWDELTRMVPREMVEETCLAGTAEEVREKLGRCAAGSRPWASTNSCSSRRSPVLPRSSKRACAG